MKIHRYRSLAVMLVLVLSVSACGGGSEPPSTPPLDSSQLASAQSTANSGLPAADQSAGPTTTTNEETAACVLADDEYMDVALYKDALACAITLFQWPERFQLDLDKLNAILDTNEPMEYRNGYEFMFLTLWNACAWDSAWLDARKRGDSAAEQGALEVMTERIPNFPSIIPGYPSDVLDQNVFEMFRTNASKAALGDPTGVQQYVDAECHFDLWKDVS